MILVNASVHINRSIGEVFEYVAKPENLPAWNSAVADVRPEHATPAAAGATYTMTRRLPTGEATNRLEIVAFEPPTRFVIKTLTGPTPFLYDYRFTGNDSAATVNLTAQAELVGMASLVRPLAERGLQRGIDANLKTLRDILQHDGRSTPRHP